MKSTLTGATLKASLLTQTRGHLQEVADHVRVALDEVAQFGAVEIGSEIEDSMLTVLYLNSELNMVPWGTESARHTSGLLVTASGILASLARGYDESGVKVTKPVRLLCMAHRLLGAVEAQILQMQKCVDNGRRTRDRPPRKSARKKAVEKLKAENPKASSMKISVLLGDPGIDRDVRKKLLELKRGANEVGP